MNITTISTDPAEWTSVAEDGSWLFRAVRLGADGPFLTLDAIAANQGTLTAANPDLAEKLEVLKKVDQDARWHTVKIGEREYVIFAMPPEVEGQPGGGQHE